MIKIKHNGRFEIPKYQAQALCCVLFKKARATAKANRELWLEMRFLFRYILLDSWEHLYITIAESPLSEESIDTS